jgi:hypothetical protein
MRRSSAEDKSDDDLHAEIGSGSCLMRECGSCALPEPRFDLIETWLQILDLTRFLTQTGRHPRIKSEGMLRLKTL